MHFRAIHLHMMLVFVHDTVRLNLFKVFIFCDQSFKLI